MNTIDASLRNTKTSGEVNKLRSEGNVPGIIYGGKSETQKISISKKLLKNLIDKENFLSSILNLKIDGKNENVLPKEISYDLITVGAATVAITKSLPRIVGSTFSGSLIEEILKEVPISTPSKSTTSSLGMFSDGHFNSTFLRTIFNTPPLFKPGDFSVLIKLTGISIITLEPFTILKKSIWIGSSVKIS